jgi:hypothetical protein
MAAFKKGQGYSAPYSETEFSESKVQGLSRDAYNPGSTPNVYVENAKGTNSVDWSGKIDDVYNWPDGTNPSWHIKGGFSGRINRTGPGFGNKAVRAGNHPRKGTDSFKSRGVDTPTEDQGGPRSGFKWR